MAAIMSTFSGGAVLTSRSVSGYCTYALVVDGGLFRTSLKCYAHLASFSASLVSNLLCLSTMDVSAVSMIFFFRALLLSMACQASAVIHSFIFFCRLPRQASLVSGIGCSDLLVLGGVCFSASASCQCLKLVLQLEGEGTRSLLLVPLVFYVKLLLSCLVRSISSQLQFQG